MNKRVDLKFLFLELGFLGLVCSTPDHDFFIPFGRTGCDLTNLLIRVTQRTGFLLHEKLHLIYTSTPVYTRLTETGL